ncbi:hypothetical protein AKO1_011367 [Acrasis kona]|uniref:DUF4190 domain-containing protein n=1 Tax=Acrasis kona TaxID=1008807 RepID=A0AAW2YYH3_9EUKA
MKPETANLVILAVSALSIFSSFGVVILTFFGILIAAKTTAFQHFGDKTGEKAQGCFIAAGMYLVITIACIVSAVLLKNKVRRQLNTASVY